MDTGHHTADFLVIGAGIAGASVAAELSKFASVVVAEMESQPGYHSTGRSAAVFAPMYGPSPIRALTRASQPYFLDPPQGFAEVALLSQRPFLMIARNDQLAALDEACTTFGREGPVQRLDSREVRELQPLLRSGYAAGGMLDESSQDIDVDALHQGYLRVLRANGGKILTRAEIVALKRNGSVWQAALPNGTISAPVVVNAAGAWADKVGALAGAEPIGLVPKRRTALVAAAPEGPDYDAMPATCDIDEEFYIKPDAGRLLMSPANEDPEQPCDVQPDEMDIAICIDRVERAFGLSIRRIENKWAGLRSFVADKCPVCGFSQVAEGFFWLAGQGGYGIQTAPALSRLGAAMIRGDSIPPDILAQGFDPASVNPKRLCGTKR